MDQQWLGNIAGVLFGIAVVSLVIFLVFREFFCWYWKINQRVALLTEIRGLLSAQRNSQSAEVPIAPQTRLCAGCGAAVDHVGSAFCTKCGAKL